MVRQVLTLFLALINSITIAQVDQQFESIRLLNCEIQQKQLINDTIYGIPYSATKLIVLANSKVQTSCNYGNPSANQYAIAKNKISILLIADTSGKLKDSLLTEINSYFNQQELWSKKYNVNNDFSNLPFYKSFYLSDTIVIPTIQSGSQRNGDFYIYYLNSTLMKIELIEHDGLGALSSFNSQNLILKNASGDLVLNKFVKKIDEARVIMETYKNK